MRKHKKCIHSEVNIHTNFLLVGSIYQPRYSPLLHLTKTTCCSGLSTLAFSLPVFIFQSSSMAFSRAMLVSIFFLALVASTMAQVPTPSPAMSPTSPTTPPPSRSSAPAPAPTMTPPTPSTSPPPMTPPTLAPSTPPESPPPPPPMGPSVSPPTPSPATPSAPSPVTPSSPSPGSPGSSPSPVSTPPPPSAAFVHGSSMALLPLLGGVALLFA